MEAQTLVRNYLTEVFTERKARNASYSLRDFSEALSLNSGIVSGILNGKRKVSLQFALKICDLLHFDPVKVEEVKKSFQSELVPENSVPLENSPAHLSIDQFNAISEWHYFAIVSLARCTRLKYDPQSIGKKLGLPEKRIRFAIETLFRMGILEIKNSFLFRTKARLQTTEGIKSSAINRSHQVDCDLALRSLAKDSVNERDFSSITFCIDQNDLSEISDDIRKFQDQLIEKYETKNKEDVYRMSVHLFPLSKLNERGVENENEI